MKATEQFIEDASKAGYQFGGLPQFQEDMSVAELVRVVKHKPHRTLLDPLAWQAVGKTRGWNIHDNSRNLYEAKVHWQYQWHRFIDHLADGKTIDQALEALS